MDTMTNLIKKDADSSRNTISQSLDQSLIHLSVNQSIDRSVSPLIEDSNEVSNVYLFGSDLAAIKRSSKQSTAETSQSVNQSNVANQSNDQSVNTPSNHSNDSNHQLDDSDDDIITTPTLLPIKLPSPTSGDQSDNQSVNQPVKCSALSLSATHGSVLTEDGQILMFGSNERGELGVKQSANQSINPPTILSSLSNSFISQVSVGLNHTLAATSRGHLWAWGSNDFGQLGLGQSTNQEDSDHFEPTQVKSLSGINIVKVVCGENHSLVLSDGGVVYVAGEAKRGALGIDLKRSQVNGKTNNQSSDDTRVSVFSPITALTPLPIVDIAAGSHHSLVLTASGVVYSMGVSRRGQTGCGTTEPILTPKRIEGLKDVNVVRVYAGGDSSACLSADGHVYVFGANQHGQIGTGDRDSRFAPVRLTEGLEDKIVVKVALGLNHMLLLCDDHSVLGSGDSSLGQLGLSALPETDEEQDYKRQKTGGDEEMALVPANNISEPNGRGDVLIPTQIPLAHGRMVIDIAAGSTSSGVILSAHSAVTPLPSLEVPKCHSSIKRLIPEAFHALVESCRADNSYVPLILYINKHFSSIQSLNASFLPVITPPTFDQGRLIRQASLTNQDPLALAIATPAALMTESNRRNTAITVPGSIDVMAVEEVYKTILKESVNEPKLTTALSHSMQKAIHEMLTQLKSTHTVADSEAYRCLAICLQSPLFSQAAASDLELLSDIAHCIDRLPVSCRKAIRRWWTQYPSEIFGARLVRSVVNAVHVQLREAKLHNVEQRADGMVVLQARIRRVSDQVQMLVKMLDLMHQSSELAQTGGLLDAKHWHIPIGDLIALDEDFINFVRAPATEAQLPAFSFLRYPYTLDAATKAAYMRIEHMHYQHQSMIQAVAFQQQPYTVFKIKRDNLVESAIYQINSFRIDELQRPLKVQFIGEEGVDEGGVSTEFFRLIVKELMSSQYELFDYDEERRQLWYNLSDVSDNPSKTDLYYITGLLIGLACYNVCLLEGVNFPMALYKSLLHSSKQSITYTLEDLFSLDPQLTRSLQHVLSYDGNDMEEVFDLNFTTSHPVHKGTEIEIKTVELIPNGTNIPVTQANKQQYVHAVIQQHLLGSVKFQSQAFVKGFRSVCSGRVLTLFTPSDLEQMCVGTPVLDFSLLKTRARYEGFRPDSPIVQWLWEILKDMSVEEKQRFLTFVTGSSRIGIGGLGAMTITIQRAGPDSESWPTASTCFSILLLNEYNSKEKLKSKLLAAIQHSEGFGLQ